MIHLFKLLEVVSQNIYLPLEIVFPLSDFRLIHC